MTTIKFHTSFMKSKDMDLGLEKHFEELKEHLSHIKYEKITIVTSIKDMTDKEWRAYSIVYRTDEDKFEEDTSE